MKIEGIPDGWELVRIGTPVVNVDWVVDSEGKPRLCDIESTFLNRVIIRKIEKPKKFRPFANPAEAEPFWDKKLRMKEWRAKEPGKAMFRINAIGDEDVSIGFQVYSYQSAFDIYECTDGTPFGIEVTE